MYQVCTKIMDTFLNWACIQQNANFTYRDWCFWSVASYLSLLNSCDSSEFFFMSDPVSGWSHVCETLHWTRESSTVAAFHCREMLSVICLSHLKLMHVVFNVCSCALVHLGQDLSNLVKVDYKVSNDRRCLMRWQWEEEIIISFFTWILNMCYLTV